MWKTVFKCADKIEIPSFGLDTFIVNGGIEPGKAYDIFINSRYEITDNYHSCLYDDLKDKNRIYRISMAQSEAIVYSDSVSYSHKCTNPLVDGINNFDDFKTIKIEEKVE